MNIAIVDDQPFLRMAIKSFLVEAIPALHIFEARNGIEALELVDRNKVDLMVLDLAMPEMDGFEFLINLHKKGRKDFKIIVLTFYNDLIVLHRLLRLGVDGYLAKDSHPGMVKDAIEAVVGGKLFFSPEFSDKELHLIRSGKLPPGKVSDKEMEIIKYLAQGMTSKEISNELDYTKRTVETKKLRIEKKFFAKNAAELINIAYKIGILKI